MSDEQYSVGDTIPVDELPENELNTSGKLEWVGDKTLALSVDGRHYELWWSHVEVKGVREYDPEADEFVEANNE